MKERFLWHVGFWMLYTLVYAVTAMNFSNNTLTAEYPFEVRLLYFWAVEFWMLPVKLVATYGFLYYLVPNYLRPGRYVGLVVRCIIAVIPLLLINRLIVYSQVYPLLYGELPNLELLSPRRLLFSLLDIASATALASTVKLLRERQQSQRREEELVREKLQSELNFLRAQTNPHFLFNTLNNIYALARKQSKNTAPVVMKLSQIMRFMLYECSSPRIAIRKEIKVIRDYIDLENIRYNDRLSIILNEALDQPGQQIAPLLLLPFVENAFKHGASESRFKSFIKIDVRLEKGKLDVCIENSKDEDLETKEGGIGLANVKRQLELIYPNSHQLDIKNEETLYRVELHIDLNQDI